MIFTKRGTYFRVFVSPVTGETWIVTELFWLIELPAVSAASS